MDAALRVAGLLLTAGLFGGMFFFGGGCAAFLFTALQIEQARQLIRRAFPPFYLFVIAAAALCACSAAGVDTAAALTLVAIASGSLPARQVLMPAKKCATAASQRARFARLHGLSVAAMLGYILAVGWLKHMAAPMTV